jgi:CDP-paratose 2-epimerase
MSRILITGGAGFVGSQLALAIRRAHSAAQVTVLDNLHRRGSELSLGPLQQAGVRFVHGDVRVADDLIAAGAFDWLLECSAEPSVLAGSGGSSTAYPVQTNLIGALNCAEACRRHGAGLLFLSSSRVYPIAPLLACRYTDTADRFELAADQTVAGLSAEGVAETFPMQGYRSLYGASKYAAEILLEEYRQAFQMPVVLLRCGVIAGPGQFGKVDQGVLTHWAVAHLFQRPLQYLGFGGAGKQVRDVIHIADLGDLVLRLLDDAGPFGQGVWNVAGGRANSVSLRELTRLCQRLTGQTIPIGSDPATRYADIPVFIADCRQLLAHTDWRPTRTVEQVVDDTIRWIRDNPAVAAFFRQGQP